MLHGIRRDRQSRRVGLEVPVRVIKMLHELILDIFRDVRDRVSVTRLSDVRDAGRSSRLGIVLHLINCEWQEGRVRRPR